MMEAFPIVQLVASVLMTRTSDEDPGVISPLMGGLKLKPITLPSALLSAVCGVTVPSTKVVNVSVEPSVRNAASVTKPAKLLAAKRANAVDELGSFVT